MFIMDKKIKMTMIMHLWCIKCLHSQNHNFYCSIVSPDNRSLLFSIYIFNQPLLLMVTKSADVAT